MAQARLTVIRGGRSEGPSAASRFERDYRESYPMVYSYVLGRMNNREAAEDVVAEAYLRAARSYDKYDPTRSKFSTWVITIARNCMVDYYRRDEPASPLEDVAEGAFASEEHTDDVMADADLVHRLLEVLDEDERMLVYLKYYEDRRNGEIAKELGMNASTVSTKLSRAMAKMRAVAS